MEHSKELDTEPADGCCWILVTSSYMSLTGKIVSSMTWSASGETERPSESRLWKVDNNRRVSNCTAAILERDFNRTVGFFFNQRSERSRSPCLR